VIVKNRRAHAAPLVDRVGYSIANRTQSLSRKVATLIGREPNGRFMSVSVFALSGRKQESPQERFASETDSQRITHATSSFPNEPTAACRSSALFALARRLNDSASAADLDLSFTLNVTINGSPIKEARMNTPALGGIRRCIVRKHLKSSRSGPNPGAGF
jgi:hypothetical protein